METHQLPMEDIKGRKEQKTTKQPENNLEKSYYKSLPIKNYLSVKVLRDLIRK